MKFFIVFAAALAAASASGSHIVAAPWAYVAQAQHLPVIGANGVPVDTAEVQHARAAHLTHKVEAHARNGDWAVGYGSPVIASYAAHAAPVVAAHHAYAAAPVVAHAAHHAYAYGAAPVVAHAAHVSAVAAPAVIASAVPAAYPTTLGVPAVTGNGVPLETPEVVAAKSNHFAAHAEALSRNSPIYAEAAPIVAATYAAAPVAAVAVAPVVAHAHTYAAAAPVVAHHGYAHHGYAHSYAAAPVVAHAHTYAAAAPIVAHHGYAHHGYAHGAQVSAIHGVHHGISAVAAPAAYATTLGVPAVTSNGVPLETPEVVAAKANHFAAHAEASARNAW